MYIILEIYDESHKLKIGFESKVPVFADFEHLKLIDLGKDDGFSVSRNHRDDKRFGENVGSNLI